MEMAPCFIALASNIKYDSSLREALHVMHRKGVRARAMPATLVGRQKNKHSFSFHIKNSFVDLAGAAMLGMRGAARRFPRRGLSSSAVTQLLHRSRIPTLHFQDSLPRMPVPALEQTLERFIYFAQPLVDDDELLLAQRAAHAFARHEGPALQAALIVEDKIGYTSYISRPWFEMYLRDRSPLLLNFNPQLTFQDEPSAPSQTNRAARLCHSAGLFLKTLEAGVLEPDIFHTVPSRSKHPLWPEVMRCLPRSVAFYGAAATGAYALDMSQYANLFRSTRVPMPGRDELRTVADSRHVVVQRGGAIWTVDLFDKAGNTVQKCDGLPGEDEKCRAGMTLDLKSNYRYVSTIKGLEIILMPGKGDFVTTTVPHTGSRVMVLNTDDYPTFLRAWKMKLRGAGNGAPKKMVLSGSYGVNPNDPNDDAPLKLVFRRDAD